MKTKFPSLCTLLALLAGTHQAAAQNAVFTYQGQVQDNGTNFTGAGQFKFALLTRTNTSRQAAAIATVSGGFLTIVTVTAPGAGYVTAPAVTVSGGGGSGAVLTAKISGGSVTSVTVSNPGDGYTSTPLITIAAPPPDVVYTTYWSNDGTSSAGSEPAAAVVLGVANGLFTVGMGDTTLANMTAISAAVFDQPNLELLIWFSDGVNGFAALNPAQPLTPAPYAIMANTASNLLGALPAAQLSGTVLLAQLPNVVVTNNETSVTLGNVTVNGNLNLPATTTTSGIIYSGGSTLIYSYGSRNFFAGPGAGNLTMSSSNNTANGWAALQNNTTGNQNTAAGAASLQSNTTGGDNTAIGIDALSNNTTGNNNTASGAGALQWNTTGANNTASGKQSLYYNTNGIENTASGFQALWANTTGSYNLADGAYALFNNTTGNYNTAAGFNALKSSTSSTGNTAVGHDTLEYNTSGSQNTAIGEEALRYNITGSNNVANGESALMLNTNGSFNTADGPYALYNNTSGSTNIALGYQAGYNITTGSSNIDIGNRGLATDTNIIRIGTAQTATYLAGTVYANGVALTSDRNAKENFAALDSQTVLARVASLPLTEWNYKNEAAGIRHLGPMAQDFQAAFQLNGGDDKHISVVDESGVALAAIQALNAKLEQESKEKDAEIQALKQSVNELKIMVQSLAEKK